MVLNGGASPTLLNDCFTHFRSWFTRRQSCPPYLWRSGGFTRRSCGVVYPPFFLSAVILAEWRRVLGKNIQSKLVKKQKKY
jgi:hypothetical protein